MKRKTENIYGERLELLSRVGWWSSKVVSVVVVDSITAKKLGVKTREGKTRELNVTKFGWCSLVSISLAELAVQAKQMEMQNPNSLNVTHAHYYYTQMKFPVVHNNFRLRRSAIAAPTGSFSTQFIFKTGLQ